MKLLLDAHTVLWAVYEPERLPSVVQAAVAEQENDLFVSLATIWELANKVAAYRLPLAGKSAEDMVRRIQDLGVDLLPVQLADILATAALPRYHADPFDRVLVAQAQARSLTLVMRDRDIAKYDVEILWS